MSPINSMLVISPKSSVKKTSSHKIYLQKITTHPIVLSRCGHWNYHSHTNVQAFWPVRWVWPDAKESKESEVFSREHIVNMANRALYELCRLCSSELLQSYQSSQLACAIYSLRQHSSTMIGLVFSSSGFSGCSKWDPLTGATRNLHGIGPPKMVLLLQFSNKIAEFHTSHCPWLLTTA